MMKKQKKRGRPQTNEPTYPLQAEKMKHAFAFLTKTQGITKQSDMAPFFGVTDTGHMNRLYLGQRPLRANHKEFCFLKTTIPVAWWEHENTVLSGLESPPSVPISDRRIASSDRRKSGHLTGGSLPPEEQERLRSLPTLRDRLLDAIMTVVEEELATSPKNRKEKDQP